MLEDNTAEHTEHGSCKEAGNGRDFKGDQDNYDDRYQQQPGSDIIVGSQSIQNAVDLAMVQFLPGETEANDAEAHNGNAIGYGCGVHHMFDMVCELCACNGSGQVRGIRQR